MRIFRYILALLTLVSLALLVFSFIKKSSLPAADLIEKDLYKAPVQEDIDLSFKPFEIRKEGFTYRITPLYKYEIYGLSVADYDSENWVDYFHKNDPLNTKDICLVWGDNLKTGAYQDASFKHGEFTCYWKTTREDIVFNNNEISNNHLLPSTDEIYQEMKKAEKGDQVHIKGYLVNYEIIGLDTHIYRNTSITRDDAGNSACEVIYVTDFEVVEKGNVGYNLLYRFSKYLFSTLFVIYLIVLYISFLLKPPIRKKEVVKEVDIDFIKGRSFPSQFRNSP